MFNSLFDLNLLNIFFLIIKFNTCLLLASVHASYWTEVKENCLYLPMPFCPWPRAMVKLLQCSLSSPVGVVEALLGGVQPALPRWETAVLLAIHCIIGWCEIKLLLKSQNLQAVYGSFIIPEQLLSTVFGHRMYQFFAKLSSQNKFFSL